MDKDFLLSNEILKKLYHKYSSVMPIIDYHRHINPQEIAEDKKFESDKIFNIKVLPTWRSDKAISIEKDRFNDYIAELSKVGEVEINSFNTWKEAILKRMEFFNGVGCKISDHGLLYIPYVKADDETVDNILKKSLRGE